jgi:hypothetical protein
MEPATLPRLIEVLRVVRKHALAPFSFEAFWIGEPASEERRITIEELVELIEQRMIGTSTRYLVH